MADSSWFESHEVRLPPPNFSWFQKQDKFRPVYVYTKVRQSYLGPVDNVLRWGDCTLFSDPRAYLCPTKDCEGYNQPMSVLRYEEKWKAHFLTNLCAHCNKCNRATRGRRR